MKGKNNKEKKEDKSFNEDILKPLISIFSFEKEFKEIKELNIELDNKKKYYLINTDYITEFKKIFKYNDYLEKNKQLYKSKDKRREFLNIIKSKFKEKDFTVFSNETLHKFFNKGIDIIPKYIHLNIRDNEFEYPKDFSIINEKIYSRLTEMDKKIPKEQINEIKFIIDGNMIIIKNQKSNYFYFLHNKNNNNSLVPEMIFDFGQNDEKIDYMDFIMNNPNIIKEIYNDKIIDFIYNDKNEIIGNIYYLNEIEINNKNNESNKKSNKYKQYLKMLIMFYINNEKFKKRSKKKIIDIEKKDDYDFFLVNKKWIDEFKYLFNYNEMLKVLEKNHEEIMKEKSDNIKEPIIEKIANELPDNIINNLNSLNEKLISKKMKNENLYKIFNKKYKNSSKNEINYFDNCGIILQSLIDLIEKCGIKINDMVKEKLYFGDDYIFIFTLEKELVICGTFNKDKNLFISQFIINCLSKDNKNKISDHIKKEGFKYIGYLIEDNLYISKINKEINKDIIDIYEITELFSKTQYTLEKLSINEKLKTLLLLIIQQQKLYQKTMKKKIDTNNLEDVFLININYLYNYQYKELLAIIKSDNKINTILQSNEVKENDLCQNLEKNKINEIKKIEQNLNDKEMNINEFFAQKEKITLSKERNIDIFDNFIIVDKFILHIFIKNKLISKNTDNIKSVKHICGNNKNIILIDNQKYILFGSVINN